MPYLFNLSALASHEHEHHELEGILMTLTPICVKAFAETKSRMKSQFEAGVTKYCAQSSGWQHLRSFQNQTCKGPIFGGRSFPPVTGTIARWWVIRVTRQTPETNKERYIYIYIHKEASQTLSHEFISSLGFAETKRSTETWNHCENGGCWLSILHLTQKKHGIFERPQITLWYIFISKMRGLCLGGLSLCLTRPTDHEIKVETLVFLLNM